MPDIRNAYSPIFLRLVTLEYTKQSSASTVANIFLSSAIIDIVNAPAEANSNHMTGKYLAKKLL